jgi:phthiodiolone/phenolphthiodiolone dimycocerosates ketoreductase
VISDESKDECDKLLSSPLVKNQILALSDEDFKRFGSSHPFGDKYQGMLDYIPSKYDKETLMKAYEKVPPELIRELYFCGTPDEIIKKIEDYARIGLKHAIIFNFTTTCDINKSSSSYICIRKVMDYFKDK